MRRRTFFKNVLAAAAFIFSGASLAVRGAAAQLRSNILPRRQPSILPPLPKWNDSTDDLDSHDFMRRCQDHERSRLPGDLVFPRAGQIWETVRGCEVQVLKWMNPGRPACSGGAARLEPGEKVRIVAVDAPKALHVTFLPVRS